MWIQSGRGKVNIFQASDFMQSFLKEEEENLSLFVQVMVDPYAYKMSFDVNI